MVLAYRDEIINRINAIQVGVETTYVDESQRRLVYLKVMVYIWRQSNRFIADMLAATPGAVVRPPYYGQIEDDLNNGRLIYITEVPPGLARPVPPRPPPSTPVGQGARESDRGGRGGGRGGGPSDDASRRQVEDRSNNPNLKRAWAALNLTGVFTNGSPYRDGTNKKVVPTDRPDTRRVCLSMALVGVCYSNCRGKHEALSDTEVQRVAEAGSLVLPP